MLNSHTLSVPDISYQVSDKGCSDNSKRGKKVGCVPKGVAERTKLTKVETLSGGCLAHLNSHIVKVITDKEKLYPTYILEDGTKMIPWVEYFTIDKEELHTVKYFSEKDWNNKWKKRMKAKGLI